MKTTIKSNLSALETSASAFRWWQEDCFPICIFGWHIRRQVQRCEVWIASRLNCIWCNTKKQAPRRGIKVDKRRKASYNQLCSPKLVCYSSGILLLQRVLPIFILQLFRAQLPCLCSVSGNINKPCCPAQGTCTFHSPVSHVVILIPRMYLLWALPSLARVSRQLCQRALREAG